MRPGVMQMYVSYNVKALPSEAWIGCGCRCSIQLRSGLMWND